MFARTGRFRDRREAGGVLADALEGHGLTPPLVVLALPRGGVPVALPIADRLAAPLGLMMVRKLGVPGRPELAMGATAGGVVVRNEEVIAAAGVRADAFERVRAHEAEVLAQRAARYHAPQPELAGRTVVLVDDGLATGMTALAAVKAGRAAGASRVVLAVPVASRQALAALARTADLVVCPLVPRSFLAVSEWYDVFAQLTDDEVVAALRPG